MFYARLYFKKCKHNIESLEKKKKKKYYFWPQQKLKDRGTQWDSNPKLALAKDLQC